MRSVIDVGQKFGRLTVVEVVKGERNTRLRCSCECGGDVLALAYNVKNGNTASCGCLSRESKAARGRVLGKSQGPRNSTHGLSSTATYQAWISAKNRCYNSAYKEFHRYGGRGIKMCARWLNSFQAFLDDMGIRPDGKTLERSESDGDYEPGNCVWATKEDQAQNRPSFNKVGPHEVVKIRRRHADGERVEILAAEHRMSRQAVRNIVSRKSWKNIE